MAANSGRPVHDVDENLPVKLPRGVRPLRRKLVLGIHVSLLVENADPNFWEEHSHAHWQVLFVFTPARCVATFRSPAGKESTIHMTGGQVWLLPPGWTHSLRWHCKADLICLYVEPEVARMAFRDSDPQAIVSSLAPYVSADPEIADLCSKLRRLSREPEEKVAWRTAITGSDLAAAILDARRILETQGLRRISNLVQRIVGKVRVYATAGNKERVPVEAMARKLGISTRHFRRKFREATGRSPQEFVIHARAHTARSHLESGEFNVEEVVDKAGYSDSSHMYRHFLAIYGRSPKSFLPHGPGPLRS